MEFDFAMWGAFMALLGSQAAMGRWLVGIIRSDRKDSQDRDAELHSRVNGVKDNYLRRDDLATHIEPLKEGQANVAKALEKMGDRFDAFLTAQATARAQD